MQDQIHGFESQNQLLCFGSTTSPMKNALPHFVVHVSNHVVKIVVVNTILSEIQWKIIISSFENKSQISHQQWRLIKDSFINWISKRFDVLNHDCGQELLTIKCDDTWGTKDLSKYLPKYHLTADSPSFNKRLPLPGPKLGSFELPFIFSLNTAAFDHSATVPPPPPPRNCSTYYPALHQEAFWLERNTSGKKDVWIPPNVHDMFLNC